MMAKQVPGNTKEKNGTLLTNAKQVAECWYEEGKGKPPPYKDGLSHWKYEPNDDLTIAARSKGWNIFSPDYAYFAQFPALQVCALCGLSVGLIPVFASPGWALDVAIPYFNGTYSDSFCPLEDKEEGAKRATLLNTFVQRAYITLGNLAPLGTLSTIKDMGDGARSFIKVTEFASWAIGLGWTLPEEFTLQTDGAAENGEEKPLDDRERDTYLIIIAALMQEAGINRTDRGVAKCISIATQEIGASVSGETVRKVITRIDLAIKRRNFK
jgi:hypothetical protein